MGMSLTNSIPCNKFMSTLLFQVFLSDGLIQLFTFGLDTDVKKRQRSKMVGPIDISQI